MAASSTIPGLGRRDPFGLIQSDSPIFILHSSSFILREGSVWLDSVGFTRISSDSNDSREIWEGPGGTPSPAGETPHPGIRAALLANPRVHFDSV